MSIASEISRIQTAKADIKSAIESKGVTVPSDAKIDSYAPLIQAISSGGGKTMYTYICLGGMMDLLSESEVSHLEGVQMRNTMGLGWLDGVNPNPDPASQYYYRFTGGYLDNSNNHTIHGMCVGDENDTKIFDFQGSSPYQ